MFMTAKRAQNTAVFPMFKQ